MIRRRLWLSAFVHLVCVWEVGFNGLWWLVVTQRYGYVVIAPFVKQYVVLFYSKRLGSGKRIMLLFTQNNEATPESAMTSLNDGLLLIFF